MKMEIYKSILFDVDSYKVSHHKQYPPGTEFVSSYIEARANNMGMMLNGEIPFVGLQPILKVLEEKIDMDTVDLANEYWTAHGLPFPYEGWKTIATELEGKLPLKIEALPEGSISGLKTTLVQVTNTDPRFFWLPTWVETKLLRVWYPVTVATLSRAIKKTISEFADKTQENSFIDFSLHDFGSRGASSSESAAMGGMAHMLNFRGTDTFAGLMNIVENYDSGIVGFSIPAAEHSTITSWGKENEINAFENMLDTYGDGTVAVVSDSYDLFKAVEEYWGKELKEKILNMEGNLVVRPDSGNPVEIVQKTVELLWDSFGGNVNSKGYKVLNDKVRVIQGDGINAQSIRQILTRLERLGFSSENIAFGMGGALLQKVDRDSLAFAMKASAAKVDGKWRDVFKDPITDKGKISKAGIRSVSFNRNEGFIDRRKENLPPSEKNMLRTVYQNGELIDPMTWKQVMENQEKFIKI